MESLFTTIPLGPYSSCLLCSGADRNSKNLDGKTALEVAELNEQADVIAALKETAVASPPEKKEATPE